MCWECHAEAVRLPAGVLNVVTGLGGDAGAPLSGHPGVNKISFTGSVETGRRVNLAAAANLRPTSMVRHDHCLLLSFSTSSPRRVRCHAPCPAKRLRGNVGRRVRVISGGAAGARRQVGADHL